MKKVIVAVSILVFLLSAMPAWAGFYDCVINCYLYSEDTGKCVQNCGVDRSIKPAIPFECDEICKDVFKRCRFGHKKCTEIYKKCASECQLEKQRDKQKK